MNLPLSLVDVSRWSECLFDEFANTGDSRVLESFTQYRFAFEICKRIDEFRVIEPGQINWSFVSRLTLLRWLWRSRDPNPVVNHSTEFSVWPKPVNQLSQLEILESLHSLAIRWRRLIPSSSSLREWIFALDRRLSTICTSSTLDSSVLDELPPSSSAAVPHPFIVDCASCIVDMMHDYFVWSHCHYHFRSCYRIQRESVSLQTWLSSEKEHAAISRLDEFIGDVRPGEIGKYARLNGVIPNDLSVVVRFFRSPFRDTSSSMTHPLESYFMFNRFCERLGFPWMKMCFLIDRDYFLRNSYGNRYYEVAFHLSEPVILRIMGQDFLVHRGRLYRCVSPLAALTAWLQRVSSSYKSDFSQSWDLSSLKKLL